MVVRISPGDSRRRLRMNWLSEVTMAMSVKLAATSANSRKRTGVSSANGTSPEATTAAKTTARTTT